MSLSADGWFNESGMHLVPVQKCWSKDYLGEMLRIDSFVTGFPEIAGVTNDGTGYKYDSVRVFKYYTSDGKEIPEATEYVPWFDGKEVRDIEIALELKNEVINALPPIPKFELKEKGE